MMYSSAFIIEDYDFHDGTYASWAESSWAVTNSRMFLMADPARERGYLSLGIIVLLMSFLTVIWVDKFATDIFVEESEAADQSLPNNTDAPAPVSL